MDQGERSETRRRGCSCGRILWAALAVVLLRWGWGQVRPVGPPVIGLAWSRSLTFTSLRDRNGRAAAWVCAPDEIGRAGGAAFSAAHGSLYLSGEGGVFRWRGGEWEPVMQWFPMSSETVYDFFIAPGGAVLYGLHSYLHYGSARWFLWRPGERIPGTKLPFEGEGLLDDWLPGGERLTGRHEGKPAVFSPAADGTVSARPIPSPDKASGPVRPAPDDLLLVAETDDGTALRRCSIHGNYRPLTLAERPGAEIRVGPVSPDGRLVACVVAPLTVQGMLSLPRRMPGPYYLEVLDVVTGQSFVRHRVDGEIERVVWPTQEELYFESFERLSKADAKMRWGPPKDIVRLTLDPPRVRVIARTVEYLIGSGGLPPVPLAVDTTGATQGAEKT